MMLQRAESVVLGVTCCNVGVGYSASSNGGRVICTKHIGSVYERLRRPQHACQAAHASFEKPRFQDIFASV